jgi:UDP-3-O-acyl-N-acetylglucosamine deacetylase
MFTFKVRNPGGSDVTISDLGIIVAAGITVDLAPSVDRAGLSLSSDLRTLISGGSLIRVIGITDQSIADAFLDVDLLQEKPSIFNGLLSAINPSASNYFTVKNQILPNVLSTSATNPGSISTATVDTYSAIVITTTGSLITLTLPTPTDTTASRFFAIQHNDTSTGTLKINGIQVAVGAGLISLWDGTAWIFIGGDAGGGSSQSPTQFISLFDDFLNSDVGAAGASSLRWSITSSGAGATLTVNTGEVNHPGVHLMDTGNNGRIALSLGVNSILLGGGEITYDWVINLTQLSEATQEYELQLGLGDDLTTNDQTDGVYFEYNRPTSVNWRICTANNTSRTKTSTSTAVVAGSWIKLSAIINIPANTVTYLINDVSVGTISTNIPTATGRELGPFIRLRKTAGNGSRTMKVDLFRIKQALTVPR